MRVAVFSAAILAVAVSAGSAEAQVRGQYGGGFIEYLMSGGGSASPYESVRPVPMRAALRDDGTLPRHAAAYGYGGPGSPRMSAADPMAGTAPASAYEQGAAIARAPDPRYARQVVPYTGGQRAGTIVIDTSARHLYLVQGGGQAIRYGIGVGRPGFLWHGVKTISAKKEWPDWTPPPEMLLRRPDLPRHMEGGPQNPLGARAMYLGSSLYRIHGTNEPHTIGQAVSSGCIRMMNDDVIDLYERAGVGTRVEVI